MRADGFGLGGGARGRRYDGYTWRSAGRGLGVQHACRSCTTVTTATCDRYMRPLHATVTCGRYVQLSRVAVTCGCYYVRPLRATVTCGRYS